MWVLVNSTGKISDGWIRDLGFNPRLYQKTDWCIDLMIKSERHKLKLSKKKKRIVWPSTIDMPMQLRPTRQVSISFDSRSGWWWVKSLKIWSHPFECWVYHTEIQQSQLVRQRTQRGNGDLEIFVLPQLPLWYASLLLLHHTYKSAAHQRTLVNRTPKCWYMVDNWWSLFEPKIFE